MTAHRSVVAVAGVVLLSLSAVMAQEPGGTVAADPRVEGRTYTFEATGAEVPYAIFVPSTYDATRESPLIVGLHGLGRPYDWLMSYDGYVDMAERDGYILVTPKGYHPRAWSAAADRASRGCARTTTSARYPITWVSWPNRM